MGKHKVAQGEEVTVAWPLSKDMLIK